MNTDYPRLAESDSHDSNRFTNHCFGPWNGGPAGLRIGLCFLCLFAIPLSGFADPEAHLKSPLIHLAEVESQKVAFHLMVPEGSPEVLRGVLLHAAHFNARTSGRWYRFCAEHGLAHLTLTEFPSGQRRPLWTSQYKGVESTRINNMLATRNRSVVLAGSAYGHLYTTPNHFPMVEGDDWKPGGHANLTILNPELDGLRFSSVMEGCGEVEMGYQENYHLFKGQVGDRELVVAVTGAKDHALSPALNSIQQGFSGGHLDGHVTIFELKDES